MNSNFLKNNIMTQEDKDLLLKDLCARIPYGVKGIIKGGDVVTTPLKWYAEQTLELSIGYMVVKHGWRPYLFPLSSMTEEQKYRCPIGIANLETFIKNESWTYLELNPDSILCFIGWLNKNHFDYRELIPKGLAIDATGLNIY